jgi:hypothetical protein
MWRWRCPFEGVFFPQNPRGDVKAGMIPEGRCFSPSTWGPYDRLSDAYGAMQQMHRHTTLSWPG